MLYKKLNVVYLYRSRGKLDTDFTGQHAHGKSRREWSRVLRQPRDPSRISVVLKKYDCSSHTTSRFGELIIDQLVRSVVVEPKFSTWHGCSHFSGFISGFSGVIR